MQEFCRW
jgi:tetratricopeptide (TPR) repeat protein